MPPGKEKKKKDSGKQLLSPHFVMPVFPRRNYHLRTYSGANLSKNTNSGALDKDVFNIAQLLMWENRGNVAEFSELAKLDRNLDTKIMDLITAQHSLNAAEVADTNRKIAARVAELESNMSYVDKKKRELKEK